MSNPGKNESAGLLDWLTLHLLPGLGAKGCKALLEVFGNPGAVLRANRKDLAQVKGLRRNVIDKIVDHPPLKEAEKELKLAAKMGIKLLCRDDELFPDLLRNIYDPPLVLYVKGRAEILNNPGVAVVGSRAATSYGIKIARSLAAQIAARGVNVISGLALGIDTVAHYGALDAKGRTIAVLGCGIDVQYPKRNWQLAQKIAESGVVVSENPIGTQPEAFRFPVRNRIISGLSLGVLVVEAAARSGSLITARLAMEEGREVFAVPGRVDSAKSSGAHRLLQEGAKLVNSVDDIFDELPLAQPAVESPKDPEGQQTVNIKKTVNLQPHEKTVMAALDSYPQHIDSIIVKSSLGAQKVNEVLLMLELKGLVESLAGQQYRVV